VANAADVADIRTALGIPHWTIWGISYGTVLAQEVLRSHPEGVRAAVLDSVPPVDLTDPSARISSGKRAFDTLFTGCEQSASCNAAYPDLRSQWKATLAAYDEHPMALTITDPSGNPRQVSLDGSDLVGGLFNAVYSTSVIPLLPSLLPLVQQRNKAVLTQLAQQGFGQLFDFSEGAWASVECRDRFGPLRTSKVVDLASREPDWALVYATGPLPVCEPWGAGAVDPSFHTLVASDIPALVLAGKYDPVAPPEGSKRVADHLGNATFVEFDATGHGVFRTNPCVDKLVVSFVGQPTAPLDTSCVSSVGPPAFKTS
jgi:pimeloyl-ACP methyl ester carboxylesterase